MNRYVRIVLPRTTPYFREAIGIKEDTGILNGKRYSVIKVAERDTGRRSIRRFLKEGYE